MRVAMQHTLHLQLRQSLKLMLLPRTVLKRKNQRENFHQEDERPSSGMRPLMIVMLAAESMPQTCPDKWEKISPVRVAV